MFKVPEKYRVTRKTHPLASTPVFGNNGLFHVPCRKVTLNCIASDGMGWEHVSVSVLNKKRTPTWDEMCRAKSLFWGDDCTVLQYHPKLEHYVNVHPYCLHLWRPVNTEIPAPPLYMV